MGLASIHAWLRTGSLLLIAVTLHKILVALRDQQRSHQELLQIIAALRDLLSMRTDGSGAILPGPVGHLEVPRQVRQSPQHRPLSTSFAGSMSSNAATTIEAAVIEPSTTPLVPPNNRSVTDFLADRKALQEAKLSLLQSLPQLQGVKQATLQSLAVSMGFLSFHDGEHIIHHGDYGEAMYFVALGRVDVFDGNGAPLSTRTEGSYFGEVVLLYGGLRTASCVAHGPVETFVLERGPFLAMLEKEPSVRRRFERQLLIRSEETRLQPGESLADPAVRTRINERVESQLSLQDTRRRQAAMDKEGDTITWQQREVLGQGAHGTVYSAIDTENGQPLAVKCINTGVSVGEGLLRSIEQESELMQRLDHPNVVKGFGIQMDESHAYVLMELLPNGSLERLLQDCGPMSESAARAYTAQMLEGLAYLHSEGVVHRDIKPANLLLGDSGVVKLADFGISRFGMGMTKTQNLAGTPAYLSPEAINGRYGVASDVWALGCTVLQLITGSLPWAECSFESTAQLIFHVASTESPPRLPAAAEATKPEANGGVTASVDPLRPPAETSLPETLENEVTPELRDFLETTLNVKPSSRGTCEALLSHPWIQKAVGLPREPAFTPPNSSWPGSTRGGTWLSAASNTSSGVLSPYDHEACRTQL